MSAEAIFPDGERYDVDESMARHSQVGDVITVDEPGSSGEFYVRRAGIVTRRVWYDTNLRLLCTNYPEPLVHFDLDADLTIDDT